MSLWRGAAQPGAAFIAVPLFYWLYCSMRLHLLTIVLSLLLTQTYAQTSIGIGAQADFPMMFNKYVGGYHHHSGSPGMRLAITHKSRQGSFSPAATISISPAALPVYSISNAFVVSMNFTQLQAVAYGRLHKKFRKGDIFYGLGVGASYFSGTGISGGGGDNVEFRTAISDSTQFIKTVAPVVALNAEYVAPLFPDKNIYYGLGVQLQYLYFFDDNTTYRIDIIDNNGVYYRAEPRLYGHCFNPMVFLNLYYNFGEGRRY